MLKKIKNVTILFVNLQPNFNKTNMKAKYNLILALFMLLITQISFAQFQTVSGVVTDQNGMPIPGVNVSTKGTSNNVQTDLDGKYKITATQNQTLVFTFIGMKTKENTVKSSVLNLKMEDDAKELNEVVINVLGVEVKKNQNASAYSKVKGTSIINSGETSLLKG
jgi:hypothetical protein